MLCACQNHPKLCPSEKTKAVLSPGIPELSAFILGIGSERIAIDFLSRITKLPPHTGDQPAGVLPLNKNKKDKQKRQR